MVVVQGCSQERVQGVTDPPQKIFCNIIFLLIFFQSSCLEFNHSYTVRYELKK